MKVNMSSRRMMLSILTMLVILACSLPVSPASPSPEPIATEIEIVQTIEPTATGQVQLPTATLEALQEVTATNLAPSCTVLQDLNLRFGPGTAYRPPIRALPANSTVTPLGFVPQGIPGGSWAYVQDSSTQDKGWVSAGSKYISCNLELASLPAVAFGTPPPPPLPKTAQTSDPDGNGFCVDTPSDYQCVGIFSGESLFEFQLIKDGKKQGENDGVEPVAFRISKIVSEDNKVEVYTKTENQKPYCVFGGNGPCNGWVEENGIYKWTAGGTPIEPGEYEMEANVTVNGNSSRWAVNFKLTLP